jgi:SpoVK/Ycf46/Vps4 family AAA+-type ATPase
MESSRRIKTEFLIQLDGAGSNANDKILIIGATNRPEELDEAVKRRLGKRLYIPLPNFEGRKMFLKTIIEKESNEGHKLDMGEEEIDKLVNLTIGYSGADLKSLCSEAAMIPLRNCMNIENLEVDQIRPLNVEDFKESLKNVKQTVNPGDLEKFMEWNKLFGSFPIESKDIEN